MKLKTCTVCGAVSSEPRCAKHRRPARQKRGYDAEYERALRAPAYLAATKCATCHEPFTADNPKTGGHVKAIRNGGTTADGIIPQCARCNYGWRRTT